MSFSLLMGLAAAGCLTWVIADLVAALGQVRRSRSGVGGHCLRLLIVIGRRLQSTAVPSLRLVMQARAAGNPRGLSPQELLALKAGAAPLGLLIAIPTGSLLPGRLPFAVVLLLPIIAFFLPDFFLQRRARQRGRVLEREFADVLELLRLALGAGLSVRRALKVVAADHAGLFAKELRQACAELDLGMEQAIVMKRFTQRCPVEGIGDLLRAFDRAEQYGASLYAPLGSLAQTVRRRRGRRIKTAAEKATPKVQLVIATLLVPSAMLLIAATIITSFINW